MGRAATYGMTARSDSPRPYRAYWLLSRPGSVLNSSETATVPRSTSERVTSNIVWPS